jgi:hypothetical protein
MCSNPMRKAEAAPRLKSVTCIIDFACLMTLCVAFAATLIPDASVRAEDAADCAPSRQGYEWCRMSDAIGAVDIERSAEGLKAIVTITVRSGAGDQRLATRALQWAYVHYAVPAAARPILASAMEQCVRSGAEISSRIGVTEWSFAREPPYACVARIETRDR